MSERARKVCIILLAIAMALYVYAPLLPAGFFGSDFGVLEAVASLDGSVASLYAVPENDGRPLATLSLALSERLWARSAEGPWITWSENGATWLRLENLLLLFVASIGLRSVLQNALRPFLGAEQARSAGVTAALFLFLHPLGVGTVAQVAERGELIAAAAGSLAMGQFLKARQERAPRIMFSVLCLTLLAAFAGRIAYLLPPLVGLLEFLSARRHRLISARLRSALITSFVCWAVVSVEWLLRQRFAPQTLGPPLGQWPELGGIALALEKLGVLLLPVDTFGIGKVGYALAVMALLLALHPGFVAARSAPRLWGRILLGWGVSLILVEVLSLGRRVEPGSLMGAHVLFPATFVMAVGSAIAATAIHGLRRTMVPALVCVAFGLLGRGHARPFEKAADHITELRRELVVLAEEQDWKCGFFLLDATREVEGVVAFRGAFRNLLNPMFLYEVNKRPPRQPWVGGGSLSAFALFSAEPEFRRQCQVGLTVLGAEGVVDFPNVVAGEVEVGRPMIRLDGFPSMARPLEHEGKAGDDSLSFPALTYRHVTISGQVGSKAPESGPPVLRWKSRSGLSSREEVFGLWQVGPDGSRQAVFDLSRNVAWLLGGEIQALWLPGTIGSEQTVSLQRAPDALPPEVVPRQVEEDWVFDVSRVRDSNSGADRVWYLEWLDLNMIQHTEFSLGSSVRGRLRAPNVAESAQGLLLKGGGPLVWRLEAREDGVPVARASGRRELGL